MRSHWLSSIWKTFHLAIYIGPAAFLCGIVITIAGAAMTRFDLTLIGMTSAAAGLIIWGCHGIRRRGRRPGFVLMSSLGTTFFMLHLYYRYSDYRWAKVNTMLFATSSSVTLTHLESRVALFLAILVISAAIGLLPPLPAANRSLNKVLKKTA